MLLIFISMLPIFSITATDYIRQKMSTNWGFFTLFSTKNFYLTLGNSSTFYQHVLYFAGWIQPSGKKI